MSAFEKEKIFVELRSYHADAFPEKLSTENMEKLRLEFAELEDGMVTMLLNLVNGKQEYVDFSAQLESFQKKVKIKPSGDRAEDADRKFFLQKIDQLSNILHMAHDAPFKLRPPRYPKPVTKTA